MADHKIHRYRLVNLTRDPKKAKFLVYKCNLPDCSHYVRIDLAHNKAALCNKCDEPFILANSIIYANGRERPVVKPICAACKDPNRGYAKTKGVKVVPVEKKETLIKDIDDLINSIIPEGL